MNRKSAEFPDERSSVCDNLFGGHIGRPVPFDNLSDLCDLK